MFFAGTSTVARFGGLIVQFVLGWLLGKDEYGIFAIALSISAVASCVRNGGTDQIIIQRGKEYDSFAPRVATFSLIFNIIASIVVISISGYLAQYYENDSLQWLLVVLAIGYLMATPAPILIAKLSIQKKFRSVAIINLITVLLKHGLTILLALFGLGVFSLVIPLALQPLIGAVICFFFIKSWPGFAKLKDVLFLDVLKSSAWVIASNLSLQLAMNIQYFLLGAYFSTASVGIYFFAVQLVNSPIALINNTVKGVVFPSLSNIYEDREKYQAAVFKSISVAYSVGIILGLIGYMIVPTIADILWQGRWQDSNIYIELMCLMIPSLILSNAIYEILASAGLWKNRFVVLVITTILEVIAIKVFVGYGELHTVILGLLLVRGAFVVLLSFYAIRKICDQSLTIKMVTLFVPYLCVLGVYTALAVTQNNMLLEAAMYGLLMVAVVYYYLLLNKHIDVNKKIVRLFRKKFAG